MRVLIADDEKLIRFTLRSQLERWGHQVVEAEDGLLAWERFSAEPFDLVVSDWMMPGMNGPELVRRIRATDRPGYVYVLMLTARHAIDDVVEGMEAGADDFVVKPFDGEELRVRLRAGERIVELEKRLADRNAELRAANDRMRRSLLAAARVQASFLPRRAPQDERVRVAWRYRPCEELAGDMLGVSALDEDHLALHVLDVSGHGVTAALHAVTASRWLSPLPRAGSLLRDPAGGEVEGRPAPLRAPEQVAAALNERFRGPETQGDFFTLVYGLLDLASGELRYVAAGHPGPVLVPADGGAPRVLPSAPPAIGVLEELAFEGASASLAPGDRVYLYTDGIVEAMDAARTELGGARLLGALAEARERPLDDSVADVVALVERWSGPAGLRDDVSILAVEMTPKAYSVSSSA